MILKYKGDRKADRLKEETGKNENKLIIQLKEVISQLNPVKSHMDNHSEVNPFWLQVGLGSAH